MSAAPDRLARIDAAAIRHNVERMRELTAPAQTMAVVKADGYGHGAAITARAALEGGAEWLGVADVDEALALRAAGIDAPVLAWLHGPRPDFSVAAAAGIDIGVSTLAQLEAAIAVGAIVQLKVDTGLSRNGVTEAELPTVLERAVASGVRVRGLFSHVSNSSPVETAVQLERFLAAEAAVRAAGLDPGLRHLASSEPAVTMPQTRLDLVRIGIATYGLAPDASIDARALGLRPAMRVTAPVVHRKRIAAGEGVSYGFDYRAAAPTELALVAAGYADGVPRAASGRAEVAINGIRMRIAGRIAMDQIVVEVPTGAVVEVGDEAVLWGDPERGEPSADEWAEWAGTIGYEIVTRVGGRTRRGPA